MPALRASALAPSRRRGRTPVVAGTVWLCFAASRCVTGGAGEKGAGGRPADPPPRTIVEAGRSQEAGAVHEDASPDEEPSSNVVADAAPDAALPAGPTASSVDPDGGAKAPAPPVEPGPAPALHCEFDVLAELSPVIPTVGIISFTTTLASVDAGHIEFGRTTDYGMTAPLDLEAPGYRTLLLGMTPSTTYHHRIVVESGGRTCVGPDSELTTGPLDAPVAMPALATRGAASGTPGFLVTASQGSGVGNRPNGMIAILDANGQPVWWFHTGITGLSRARLSWDGKYLYARDANPSGMNVGQVLKVSMDGLEFEALAIPYGHHDLAVTPDNGLLFFTKDGSDGCDNVTKLSADGTSSPLFDVRDAFGDEFDDGSDDPCHCNSIHFNTEDQTITFSCLSQNAYVKITAEGELVWVLGGSKGQSQFTGDGSQWLRQHGHDMITPTRLLFFNNDGGEEVRGLSLAIEVELDLEQMTATRIWTYDGEHASTTFGDVAQLPNGHRLITYSNVGVIHEVNANAELVQEWLFPSGLGYVEYRDALYGPPRHP